MPTWEEASTGATEGVDGDLDSILVGLIEAVAATEDADVDTSDLGGAAAEKEDDEEAAEEDELTDAGGTGAPVVGGFWEGHANTHICA
jgi:hypothetical protein